MSPKTCPLPIPGSMAKVFPQELLTFCPVSLLFMFAKFKKV
jgi:hypothetical protein